LKIVIVILHHINKEKFKMTRHTSESELPKEIKLIWDFRGAASAKTAEHHEIHLKQYINTEKLSPNITGFEIFSEIYAIAYMVVTEENMIQVRDALKPHRGELFE
jgi:hypothetical protein